MIRRPLFIATAFAFLTGCAKRSHPDSRPDNTRPTNESDSGMMGGGMMEGGMMEGGMMNVSQRDMSTYMEMFDHHQEIRRKVEHLANGIRTTTESDNPRIAQLLQEHVLRMYEHVNAGNEVRCMSKSLPTMFSNAKKYTRHMALTAKGVVVVETSGDRAVFEALRRHADEVSGFVREGMPAMMRGMMR